MENIILIDDELNNAREYSSGKRIKVSSGKLNELKKKYVKEKIKLEENKVKEPEVPNIMMEEVVEESFFEPIKNNSKPEIKETKTYDEIRKTLERKPYSFEEENNEINSVSNEPAEQVKKQTEYSVPNIKSSTNVGDRSLKIRKMSESVDPNTVVGKVLINGVSRLDENKNEIAKIKINIERLEQAISDLERQKEAVSGGKSEIEDILSKTATVSLTEIREAAKLDSSERAKKELDKIKESIDALQRIKSEEEEKLSSLEQEKTKLEEERSRQKTRLMSAERNGIEICDTIEKDLTTAGQIERLEREREALEKQLSLTREEEPKKPVDITNPFDRMRMATEEVKSR